MVDIESMDAIAKETWDYQESVESVKAKVYRWKKLTLEIIEELYIARQQLSKTGVYYREGGTNDSPKTWGGYCDDIGLSKRTVNRWLAKFNPDTKQIRKEEPKQIEAPKRPKNFDALVAHQKAMHQKAQEFATKSIDATEEIGRVRRQKAIFRLAILRVLLAAHDVVLRSIPTTSISKENTGTAMVAIAKR